MNTIYDAVTIAIFAGLVALFLQRAVGEAEDPHPLWSYLIPSIGCAVANQLGNKGQHWAAVALIGATIAYILVMLRPFGRIGGR